MRVNLSLIACLCLIAPHSIEASSTQAHMVQVVQALATTTNLEVPAGSTIASNSVAINVEIVSVRGVRIPNGLVFISDGSSTIGTFGVADGKASGTVTITGNGTHQLVACYGKADNYLASCSAPVTLSVGAPYTLQQGIVTSVVDGSKPFIDKLKVIPAKNFTGVVQLGCQVPAYQCALSPSSVSFPGDGQTQIVQVSFIPTAPLTGLIVLPIVAVIAVRLKRSFSLPTIALLTICTYAVLGLTGCGPIVAIPLNATNYTMLVNSTSGTYSQAVTYDIHVNDTGAGPSNR